MVCEISTALISIASMSKQLSRQALGENCSCGVSTPCKQPGVTLLAAGSWSEDSQAHQVSLYSLGRRPGDGPDLHRLASLLIDGPVSDVCMHSTGETDRTLWAVTRSGGVHHLELSLPDDWQGSLESMQVRGEGVQEAFIRPIHRIESTAAITGAALISSGSTVACVDWNGTISEVNVRQRTRIGKRDTGLRLTCIDANPAGTSYVTGDWAGALRVWDPRAQDEQVLPAFDPVVGVWVHPTQPHVVAAAHLNELRMWDLRRPGAPIHTTNNQTWVTCAAFLPDAQPALAYGTADGVLGVVSTLGEQVLYREPTAGLVSLVTADDALLAFTDQEGLLIVEHALR